MVRRVQVQNPLGIAPAAQPAASPVSTFYSPRLPDPAMRAAIDLSPLSAPLTAIAQEQASRGGEVAYQAGQKLADEQGDRVAQAIQANASLDGAEARAAANQKAFADLARDGKIEVWQNPWALAGAMESLGRRRAREFGERLMFRTGEVSTLIDPQTGAVTAPKSPEEIVAQERGKVPADSLSGDFYFQRGFGGVATQAEEEFVSAATKRQAQAKIEASREQSQNELGGLLRSMASSEGEPTDAQFAGIREFITREFHDRGMDAREIVLNAAKFAYMSSPLSARGRLLDYAESLQVGTTTLGDDASANGGREVLDALRRDLESDTLREEGQEDARVARERVKASNAAWDELSNTYLDRVVKGGENAWSVFVEWRDSSKAPGSAIAEAQQKYVAMLNAGERSDPDTERSIYSTMFSGSQGGLSAARALYDAASADGRLSAQSIATIGGRLTQMEQENTSQATAGLSDVEQSAYRFASLAPEDMRPGIVTMVESELDSLAAEFAEVSGGMAPPERAKWLAERKTALKARVDAEVAKKTAEHDAVTAEVNAGNDKGQDMTGSIRAARDAGRISEGTAQRMLDDNAKSLNVDQYFRSPAMIDAKSRIQSLVDDEVEASDRAAKALWRNVALRRLDSALNEWVANERPKLSRGQVDGAMRTFLMERVDQLVKDSGASFADRAKAVATDRADKEGAGPTETLDAQARVEAQIGLSDDVAQHAREGNFEAVYADLFPETDPNVSGDFYEVAAEVYGKSGWIFNATPAQLHRAARHEIGTILKNDKLTDEAKQASALHVLSKSYVPPDLVLTGAYDTSLLNPNREAIKARSEKHHRLAAELASQGNLESAEHHRARARFEDGFLTEAVVKFAPGKIDPYNSPFARDAADLRALAGDKARMDALLEKLGVPPTDVKEWLNRQATLLEVMND